MATVYRKTPKGVGEIETRANRLTPRLRSTLILVDGRKSDSDLRALVSLQFDETIAALVGGGFIEASAAPEVLRASTTPPAPSARSSGPATVPQASPSRNAELLMLRRDAVRALNDQVGPSAEVLAMKIERCQDAADLRLLLESAVQLIGNVRGTQAAAAFRARFVAV